MFIVRAQSATARVSVGVETATKALRVMSNFEEEGLTDIECFDYDDSHFSKEKLTEIAGKEVPPRLFLR